MLDITERPYGQSSAAIRRSELNLLHALDPRYDFGCPMPLPDPVSVEQTIGEVGEHFRFASVRKSEELLSEYFRLIFASIHVNFDRLVARASEAEPRLGTSQRHLVRFCRRQRLSQIRLTRLTGVPTPYRH